MFPVLPKPQLTPTNERRTSSEKSIVRTDALPRHLVRSIVWSYPVGDTDSLSLFFLKSLSLLIAARPRKGKGAREGEGGGGGDTTESK